MKTDYFKWKSVEVKDYTVFSCDWCRQQWRNGWESIEYTAKEKPKHLTSTPKSIESTIEMDVTHSADTYGGYATHYSVDLCPSCMQSLFDWMESKNININKVESDW